MTPVHRWDGRYFGFFVGDNLFDAESNYLGWRTKDGQVRRADGSYLGEIRDKNYILRRTNQGGPAKEAARIAPASPGGMIRHAKRMGRASIASCVDALNEFPDA